VQSWEGWLVGMGTGNGDFTGWFANALPEAANNVLGLGEEVATHGGFVN
jgi:hypothetical protein